MSTLKEDIFNIISNGITSVHCDNCYFKNKCPQEQKLEEGTCVDWSISNDLAEDITYDIINLIRNRLEIK